MILVDTSLWIDHLRKGNRDLATLLGGNQVAMHPMILGELACGNLGDRETLLNLWKNLPRLKSVTDDEALFFLDANRLMGKGIGYVDLHLLASVSVDRDARLWTRDRRLLETATSLGLAYA